MKFDSNLVLDLSVLSKTEIVKRLQAAVRETQGTKRASWAPTSRPVWWLEEHDIEIGDGRTIKSLKFESKSKANWDAERARTTLLLYMHRNSFSTDATQSIQQPTVATKSEESSQPQHPPAPPPVRRTVAARGTLRGRNPRQAKNKKLVAFDTEEGPNATRTVRKNLPKSSPEPIIISSEEEDEKINDKTQDQVDSAQQHAPVAGPSTRGTERRRRRVRVAPEQIDSVSDIAENKTDSDVTPLDVDKKRLSDQTDETAIEARADQHETSEHDDHEMIQTVEFAQADDASATNSEETPEQEEARRQKTIQEKKATLQAQVAQELKKLDRRVKTKREEIMRQLAVEIESVQSAHAVARFQLSKEACDTPLVQYINECNADSREWLLKMVAGRATRTFEELDVVDDHNTSRTESQKARMNEALKTARKVTRAARQREIDNGTCKAPTMMTRARPTRTAAKTALKRNQEILGRRERNAETARVTRTRGRRDVENETGGLETPRAAGAEGRSHTEAMEKFIALLRTQPNPEKFVQKCWSAFHEEQAEGK